jgi:predicted enzyme related to lactoylglutathione lyase
MSDARTPSIFRVPVEVSDLAGAVTFYSTLLDSPGRQIRGGSRHYYDCGSVILALIDVSGSGRKPRRTARDVYFAVSDLEAVHARAKTLGCLSKADVHEASGGEIEERPWGERSFYAEDPWGNGLCFVDDTTLFTGL